MLRTLSLLACICLLGAPHAAAAQRAALVFDPSDGTVVFAQNVNRPSHPASLAKLMTVYLVLEAIDAERLSLQDPLPVSQNAARQQPMKLGLKRGSTIKVQDMLMALVIPSANDAAVVAAEALAGSEAEFVERMNAKAVELGLSHTVFGNASGLPDAAQVTTARDMALLARALQDDFAHHFQIFSTLGFDYRGRRIETHNNFLRAYDGGDGLKTGFTCKAGYNLVASAKRDGQRFIGVLLGEKTAGRRDARMVRLFNTAFSGKTMDDGTLDIFGLRTDATQGADDLLNRSFIAAECINPRRAGDVHRATGWSLEFGLETEKEAAKKLSRRFIREHRGTLKGGRVLLIPRWARDIIYRVGVTGLEQAHATATCTAVREADAYCVVRTPKTARLALDQALKILEHAAGQAVSQ